MKNTNKLLEQLPSEFLKQFQSGEEFQQFMDALFKRDVKQLPEAEPHEHLGYEKHGSLLGENVRKSDISIPSIKRKEVAVEQPLSFRVSLV
ncbi:MAG: hypothetical protein ACTHJ5_16205 [Ilyomonas sp.]